MSRETRKIRLGTIVANKMKDTVVVEVKWQQKHLMYRKAQRRVTKFYAHYGGSDLALGDLVKIQECRPISRLKRWRVLDIIEHREVPDVKPVELDRELIESYSAKKSISAEEALEPIGQLDTTDDIKTEESVVSDDEANVADQDGDNSLIEAGEADITPDVKPVAKLGPKKKKGSEE